MITKGKPIATGLTFDDVLLVPKRTTMRSRSHVDVSSMLTQRIPLRVPMVSANTPWCTGARMAIAMAKVGGIGFVHRMCSPEDEADAVEEVKSAAFSREEFPNASVDRDGRLRVGAAVGVRSDYLRRADLVVERGADLLVVDIAHGHADYALEVIAHFKARYAGVDIVAGNVATSEGARDLIGAGADAVKVGVGPGAVCTTRLVTGCGVPQITAIIDCVDEARRCGIPVIADGGIRTSGDITKAISAGASTVMLGRLLAGSDESEARLIEVGGTKYKITTGFVTLGVELTLRKLANKKISREEFENYVPEGVEATFPYAGPLDRLVRQYLGGLRSGMSYSGAENVADLWEKAEFIQVTNAGWAEGTPHVTRGAPQVHPDYEKALVG
ncbi:IMP dehydrogenase [Sorangium sp. So ce1128]